MRFIIRLLVTAVGVFVVAYVGLLHITGIGAGEPFSWGSFGIALLFALILGLINAVLRPIVKLISAPLIILTLGIFSLIVNLLMFYLAAAVMPNVQTVGLLPTIGAALVVALFHGLGSAIVDRERNEYE